MKNLREINCTSAHVGIDFDGTLHKWADYPNIGEAVPHAYRILNRLQSQGHKIILWTVRDGWALTYATEELEKRGIYVHDINNRPGQIDYSASRKIDCETYIDDKALGCPLIFPDVGKPYVDWLKVEKILEDFGWLEPEHSQADGYSV